MDQEPVKKFLDKHLLKSLKIIQDLSFHYFKEDIAGLRVNLKNGGMMYIMEKVIILVSTVLEKLEWNQMKTMN